MTRNKATRLFGSLILLLFVVLVVLENPTWPREVTLEEIEPIKFSADDQNKIKVAIFYSLSINNPYYTTLPAFYDNIFEALSVIESQTYKIIINPFKINTFDTSETFAYDAGRKMEVDIVAFIKISLSLPTSIIGYSLIDTHNQKASVDNLVIRTHGRGIGLVEPRDQPMTIAKQLSNKWKPFLSSLTATD